MAEIVVLKDDFHFRVAVVGFIANSLHVALDVAPVAAEGLPNVGDHVDLDRAVAPGEFGRVPTASIFLFAEPLAGWREATARTSKTKLDWAVETARLLEGRYRRCPIVTLVCDNLNTHTIGAFYEAFSPARARAMVRRLRFCHTPKHGSWLNIAENELSSLTRQCVSGRRFGALAKLKSELAAWSTDARRSPIPRPGEPTAAESNWRSPWAADPDAGRSPAPPVCR